MNKILFLAINFFITGFLIAQDSEVFTRPETYPYFQIEKCEDLKGEELTNCSARNLAEYTKEIAYPEQAIENKEEGKVYLRFIVHENGTISNVTIAKSSGSQYLDRAAIQHIIMSSGQWYAATRDGKAIATEFVMPFNFKL